jgi:hypothetical protein
MAGPSTRAPGRTYTEFTNKLGRLVFFVVQDPWWLSFPDRYVTYSQRHHPIP